MYKKLICLMLVLGVVSVAVATPQLSGSGTIKPGQTITLTLSGTSDEATDSATNLPVALSYKIIVDRADGYYGPRTTFFDAVISNPSDFTSNVGGASPPSIAPYIYPSFYSYGIIHFTAGSSLVWSEATDIDEGPWFTFDLTLDSDTALATNGSLYIPIDLFVGNGSSIEQLSVQVIPEPMTIALLGLGALALRKRS